VSRVGLVVDLFAGGGGASAGIEAALGRCVDIGINHDPVALAVHKANHPGTRHLEAPTPMILFARDRSRHATTQGGTHRLVRRFITETKEAR
jgi:site-specific DNA-cytosine methylase